MAIEIIIIIISIIISRMTFGEKTQNFVMHT